MKLSILTSLFIGFLMVSCTNATLEDNTGKFNSVSSALIADAVSKISPEVKANFDRVFDEWHTAYKAEPEIRLSSRYVYPDVLPQYAELVAMGESILPLVAEKMAGSDYYFSRLVYEGIRPADKLTGTDILGRERAREYVRMWAENYAKN